MITLTVDEPYRKTVTAHIELDNGVCRKFRFSADVTTSEIIAMIPRLLEKRKGAK